MKADANSQIGRIGVTSTQLLFTKLGWIFREQPIEDYGIDAHVEIVENEQATGKLIALQIKSGDGWFKEKNETGIIFRGEPKHLEYWQEHSLPVLIILYNVKEEIAYWQIVNQETVQNTGKGWKLIVPFENKVEQNSKEAIQNFSRKLTAHNKYIIISLSDKSHAVAKRYSANIVLSRDLYKYEIYQIIKEVTADLITRQYYRNAAAKEHWKDKNADVIWLFIYLSLDDLSRTNWICRTQWISEKLAPEFSPMRLEGESMDGGIIVDWNKNYRDLSNLLTSYEVRKEDYLDSMLKIRDIVKNIVAGIIEVINKYDSEKLDELEYISLMSNFEIELTKVYHDSSDLGVPPIECQDLGQQFQRFLSVAHNMVIPFSERGLKIWEKSNREFLLRQAVQDYQKELLKLEFELEKIH